MTPDEISKVLKAHAEWLVDPLTGSKAALSGANLSGANLSGANLGGALGYVPVVEKESGSCLNDW